MSDQPDDKPQQPDQPDAPEGDDENDPTQAAKSVIERVIGERLDASGDPQNPE